MHLFTEVLLILDFSIPHYLLCPSINFGCMCDILCFILGVFDGTLLLKSMAFCKLTTSH